MKTTEKIINYMLIIAMVFTNQPFLGGGSGIAIADDNQSSPSNIIEPGTGFTGPTDQPAAVGDPLAPGYTAKAIARWDVVPYQTFNGTFNVGVVAFHINGIKEIDFTATDKNGASHTYTSNAMTLNPQIANDPAVTGVGIKTDGVVEYWVPINASDFADGPVEITATAYPTAGVPRVLDSLRLYANYGNTLPRQDPIWVAPAPAGSDTTGTGTEDNPYASILWAAHNAQSDTGAVIYMKAGTYAGIFLEI